MIILTFVNCTSSDSQHEDYEVHYYSCSGNIVIRSQPNASQNCLISIYDGKMLVTGRQLQRYDSLDWNYLGGDILARITDSTITVEYRGTRYDDCLIAPAEKAKREGSDTLYYITNTGGLIKTLDIGDSILITMGYPGTMVYSGMLPRVPSGSGVKYEDSDVMFWTQGNTAMFIYQGINYSHCIRMWEDEIKADPCDDVGLDRFVQAFLDEEFPSDGSVPLEDRRYYAEYADINDDGEEEVFIAMRSPSFCGTGGCTWYIVHPDTTELARVTVTQFPLYVSNEKTNGYLDLFVQSRDKYYKMSYDGNTYPSNPTMEDEIRVFSMPEYTNAGATRVFDQAYLKSCPF